MAQNITSPLALAGLLTTVIGDPENLLEDSDSGVIGSFLFAYEATQLRLDVLSEDEDEAVRMNVRGRRGCYSLVKSNALTQMIAYADDRWHRQFFRYVTCFVILFSLT